MTNKMVMVIMMVLSVMMMVGCDGTDGNVTTDTVKPTAIPLGDDTATDLADDVIDGGNAVTDSAFMKLWAATAFDTIDDCFTGCDAEYPDYAGNKTVDNLDCVAECKTEFAE